MVHNGRYLTARGEEGWVYGAVSRTNASQLRSQETFPGFSEPSRIHYISRRSGQRFMSGGLTPLPLLQLVKVPRRHSPSCVDTRGYSDKGAAGFGDSTPKWVQSTLVKLGTQHRGAGGITAPWTVDSGGKTLAQVTRWCQPPSDTKNWKYKKKLAIIRNNKRTNWLKIWREGLGDSTTGKHISRRAVFVSFQI